MYISETRMNIAMKLSEIRTQYKLLIIVRLSLIILRQFKCVLSFDDHSLKHV